MSVSNVLVELWYLFRNLTDFFFVTYWHRFALSYRSMSIAVNYIGVSKGKGRGKGAVYDGGFTAFRCRARALGRFSRFSVPWLPFPRE